MRPEEKLLLLGRELKRSEDRRRRRARKGVNDKVRTTKESRVHKVIFCIFKTDISFLYLVKRRRFTGGFFNGRPENVKLELKGRREKKPSICICFLEHHRMVTGEYVPTVLLCMKRKRKQLKLEADRENVPLLACIPDSQH